MLNLDEIRKHANEAHELIGKLHWGEQLSSDNYDIIATSMLDIPALVSEVARLQKIISDAAVYDAVHGGVLGIGKFTGEGAKGDE